MYLAVCFSVVWTMWILRLLLRPSVSFDWKKDLNDDDDDASSSVVEDTLDRITSSNESLKRNLTSS